MSLKKRDKKLLIGGAIVAVVSAATIYFYPEIYQQLQMWFPTVFSNAKYGTGGRTDAPYQDQMFNDGVKAALAMIPINATAEQKTILKKLINSYDKGTDSRQIFYDGAASVPPTGISIGQYIYNQALKDSKITF